MDESLVFEKTPQGTAEVATRRAGLSLQARRVLIMIDGDRSLSELSPLVPDGAIDEVIGLLYARGLIRAVGEAAPSDPSNPPLSEVWHTGSTVMPPIGVPTESRTIGGLTSSPATRTGIGAGPVTRNTAPPAPPPPAPEERVVLTIDEVKRRAVHELNERLGPDAEYLAMRIERCSGAEDLREQLREAERLVARTISETAAQEFVRAVRRRP
jgi:hypothetical protein